MAKERTKRGNPCSTWTTFLEPVLFVGAHLFIKCCVPSCSLCSAVPRTKQDIFGHFHKNIRLCLYPLKEGRRKGVEAFRGVPWHSVQLEGRKGTQGLTSLLSDWTEPFLCGNPIDAFLSQRKSSKCLSCSSLCRIHSLERSHKQELTQVCRGQRGQRRQPPPNHKPSVSQGSGHVLQPLKPARNLRSHLEFPRGRCESPTGPCEQGYCRHSPWVPIYKITKFEQTAAVQALNTVSRGRCRSSPRACDLAVILKSNTVERTGWKAKDLSGSFALQCCQKVYKNVIVSQLLVIMLPFTLAVGNKKKKSKYHFCTALAFLWPFSSNNRLNIKRQKSLLGALTSAKENE